jgi:hypothetical protein
MIANKLFYYKQLDHVVQKDDQNLASLVLSSTKQMTKEEFEDCSDGICFDK